MGDEGRPGHELEVHAVARDVLAGDTHVALLLARLPDEVAALRVRQPADKAHARPRLVEHTRVVRVSRVPGVGVPLGHVGERAPDVLAADELVARERECPEREQVVDGRVGARPVDEPERGVSDPRAVVRAGDGGERGHPIVVVMERDEGARVEPALAVGDEVDARGARPREHIVDLLRQHDRVVVRPPERRQLGVKDPRLGRPLRTPVAVAAQRLGHVDEVPERARAREAVHQHDRVARPLAGRLGAERMRGGRGQLLLVAHLGRIGLLVSARASGQHHQQRHHKSTHRSIPSSQPVHRDDPRTGEQEIGSGTGGRHVHRCT